MAETKTTIPVEIKMGNAGTNDANLPAFKEGSIIFTKDTKKIYIDPVGETERIAVGGTEVDLSGKQDKFATIEDTTNPYLILNFDSDGYVQTNLNINYPIIKDTSSQDKVKIDSKNFSIGETATGGVEFKAGSSNGDSFKITTGVMTDSAIPTIQFAPAINSTESTGVVRLTGIAAPTADNDAANKKYINDNILDYISLSYAAGPSGNQETTSITADNSSTITLLNKDGIGIGISKGALAYIGPSNATLVGFNIDNSPIASEKYVNNSIATQVSSVYKAKGSITNLTALPTPDKAHEGYVYNIESAFTTTANFVEGADKVYPAGTNVVCINTTGTTYKWDVLAGMVDLSNYATKTDLSGKQDKFATVTNVDSTQTVTIANTLTITTNPNLLADQIISTKALYLQGSPTSGVRLGKTVLEGSSDFDATAGYLRVRDNPLADDFAVNKKYVDDIKTELLNAITHPYTYDETTKELTLIL